MTPNLPKEVMCNMNNTVIPRPPALPPGPLVPTYGIKPPPKLSNKSSEKQGYGQGSVKSKTSHSSEGFRLVDISCQNNDETGSVYSIYKQKIDSMFESDSSSTKNSVQAKIEKMFNDVAKDNGISMDGIGAHTFSVDYLGSIPLNEKVTSLSGLQNPLRDLYFTYKKIMRTKKTLTGRLEISGSGLKVQYQGEKGDLEQLNSFPTIAVWSAVKFVIHDDRLQQPTYAFLPLITDPDNMDKRSLFRPLDDNEKKFITTEAHSPLFAVVMRKIGVQKQLECHGFVCQTSEDAIVIAATLYKSLVAHMKAKEKKPRNKNGVTTCMSINSSLNKERSGNSIPVRPPRKKRSTTSSVASENDMISIPDTKPLLKSHRQPKKSIKSRRAPKAPDIKPEDLDAILPYEEPIKCETNNSKNYNDCQINRTHSQSTSDSAIEEIKPKTFTDKLNTYMTREQKQLTAEIKQVMNDGGTKCLKKVVRKNEEPIRKAENSGDILTKVTIPRSGSFLNAGGLTRYKNKGSRSNDQGSGGSPLGFKEIFNELSLQEGLHSLDDILSVIIDPEGMSFNDLKPIYKEFLLKLSLTLTKDELYQRSKSIMRRQKKKLLRKTPQQKRRIKIGGKFKRLKHIFQRSMKMKLAKKPKQLPVKDTAEAPPQIDAKPPESSISTSSYDTRQFRPKEHFSSNKKQTSRKKSRRDRASTSEESDFFSLKKSRTKSQGFTLLHNQNRNSSSGYVSCSECSYDSDTCTCVSADKCYCSLGQKNSSRRSRCHSTSCRKDICICTHDNSVVYCECDTDSCAESNKCYCPKGGFSDSVMEKLEQKGFRPDPNHHRQQKLCKKNSNTKSTKSLEYILNPPEKYYEKLKNKKFGTQNSMPILSRGFGGNEFEKFSLLNGSLQNLNSRMLYGNGIGPCRPVTVKSYGSERSQRSAARTTAISSGACTEALSVKKSAEIAALFSDIKLSQTTDIAHLNPTKFDVVSSKNSYNKHYSHSKYGKSQKNTQSKSYNHYTHLQKNNSALYSLKLPNNTSRSGMGSVRSGTNNQHVSKNGKSNMYSAKNGLYTIQSQSDESRRSSSCEGRKLDARDYFELKQEVERSMRNVSSNIENSLGYLP